MNWQDKIELPNDKDYNKFLNNIMKTRKLIDLDRTVKVNLTIQAAKKEMSLKAYIEEVLTKLSKKS